ncbi:ABC transporter permease subunit [Gordonia sp. HNM0687]|uniref:ABC transporter permease subunit n=1 Tax=Gordonia mangrovi TaxID=2665643 RepID=A0A6L7GUY0_9ACTN|nr:ABC transporter permease subunit [Gordonia mangrovi]MXP23844.1 ABC transporter permease subunit [Gordonia mangrovi]UVF76402.1 ABC transporter permease subunit [Gordonia mangrovi]
MTSTVKSTPVRSRTLRAAPPWVPPILLAGVVLLAWAVTASLADSAVYPGPIEALQSLLSDIGSSRLQNSIVDTTRVLLLSYLAAVAVGSIAGMLLGLSAFWSTATLPVVYALNSIPKIVLYPIFLLFLGIGDFSRGSFAFVSGVLPMFLIMVEATSNVSRLHLKLAASLGMSRISLMRRIVVPSVLPSFASGMRLCFGLTLIGLILAEMFSSSTGLGYELLRNLSLARVEDILGQVILIGLLALIPTFALQYLEIRIRNRYEVAP